MSAVVTDDVLADANDLAREAAVEGAASLEGAGSGGVGEHLGVSADGDLAATHTFAARMPGYRGWHWAVSLVRAPQSSEVTVNEVVLLPGPDALVAPAWTPYAERVQPGDLSPGDVLPPDDEDPRLVPAWFAGEVDAPASDRETVRELVGQRDVVLSLEGRAEAADRWYSSDYGPDTAIARKAPGSCGTCGFLVRLDGPLAGTFGVCANGRANADGHVVATSHGCGAHSSAKLKRSAQPKKLPPPVVDTFTVDDIDNA